MLDIHSFNVAGEGALEDLSMRNAVFPLKTKTPLKAANVEGI